ncbi:MAG TPA: hypothetical protein VNI58_06085 [Mariprofundaceae bacterium]|nr:hypothetical protein [Mariprofundaceae bacterium]
MLQSLIQMPIRMLLLTGLLLAMSPATQAADIERHQMISGVSIYLGVLPIQMAKNEADELKLPNNVYSQRQRYYVLFALFDEKSGQRIVDADVKASVQALGGLDFTEKKLTPIHVEKMISYGNYFRMADPDIYHIQVWITRAGESKPVTAIFVYHRPKD